MVQSTNNPVHVVTIYTIPNCEFCEKSKNLLHSKLNYVIYEVDISTKPTMKQKVKDTLGTTVPQIVIDGNHIGGYQELQEHLSQWD